MRFVELRPTPDGSPLHLHPRITWLKGLDPADRVALVGMVHDVALGLRPDWDGAVEIEGSNFDLGDAVERLGETAHSALVIDAASLPEIADDRALEALADQVDLEAATTRVRELDERISSLAEELEASSKIRAEMNGHLTSSLAQVDDSAVEELDRTDGDLGRAARLADRPDPWTGMRDVPKRIEELRAQIEDVDQRLDGLPTGDRPALAAAVATARAALVSGPVSSPEAAALAQAWSSLHQRLRGLESRLESAGGGTEAVAARLEAARTAARKAENAVVPRVVSAEDSAELERLHEEMIDAEDKLGRGLRRGANQAVFEAAAKALEDALEPLGYPTWAGFRMGNGFAVVPPRVLVAHERANAELEVAELEWAMLLARIENDTELQDVLGAIDRALEHAAHLLGFDPLADSDEGDEKAVMSALGAHVVDASSVGVARDAGIAHLRAALAAAGAAGHESIISDAAIVALGDSWIQVLVAADELAVRLLRDRERAAEELEALENLREGTGSDRLDRERSAVHAAEAKVALTREALAQVVDARLRLHVLAATELNLAEEHDDRLVQRDSAQGLVDVATGRVEGAGAAALAARVPRGPAGAVPVVVVMGDAPAATLDRLVALPDDVQILVIGDGEGMEEWLAAGGPDVGAVVAPGTLV